MHIKKHQNKIFLRLNILFLLFPLLSYADKESDLSIHQALTYVWGNYNAEKKIALWKNIHLPKEKDVNVFDSKEGNVSVELFKKYQEDGKEKYFLITKTIPEGKPYECHACAPLMSAVVFTKNKSGWKIAEKNLYFGQLGEWGQIPQTKLIQIGSEKYGVLLTSKSQSQGYNLEFIQLIAPVEKSIKVIFEQKMYNNNFDACVQKNFDGPPCWGYKGHMKFKPNKVARYFDIEVERFGTQEVKGKILSIEDKIIYRFSNGSYRVFKTY